MGLDLSITDFRQADLPSPDLGGTVKLHLTERAMEARGAKKIGDHLYIIETPLSGGYVGISWVDTELREVTRETVYDASGGAGARGPTQAEMEIMRGNLEVNRGILEENIRSNKVQETLALGELGISKETLEEMIRSSLAQEAENKKDRALDAASNALSGYLRAAELSDVRRLSALQMRRDFLPFQVDPDREFFGGGPEGALATALGGIGLPYTGTKIQHQTVDPDALAQLDPTIAANLDQAITDVTTAGQPEGLFP